MFIWSLIAIKHAQWLDCGREKGAGRAQYRVLSAVSPMPLTWQAAASAAVRENWGDSPGALDCSRLLPQWQLNLSSQQRIGHSQDPVGSVPVWGILSKVLLCPRRVMANLSMWHYMGRMSSSSLTTHQRPTSASPTSHICLQHGKVRGHPLKHWGAPGTG